MKTHMAVVKKKILLSMHALIDNKSIIKLNKKNNIIQEVKESAYRCANILAKLQSE